MGLTREQLWTLAGFNKTLSVDVGPAMAGLHFADSVEATEIIVQSTWTKAANTTSLEYGYQFEQTASNRLSYTGSEPARAVTTASVSFRSASNNQTIAFSIHKNGVLNVPSIIRSRIATGSDVQAVSIAAYMTLVSGDYMEVWVANDTSTGDITIDHGNMHAIAFYP